MIINLKRGHSYFAKKVTFLFCLDRAEKKLDIGEEEVV